MYTFMSLLKKLLKHDIFLKNILYSVTMDFTHDIHVTGPTVYGVQNENVSAGIFSIFQCYNHPICCSWNAWFHILCTCCIYYSEI